jgi:hypothetical protein
MQAKPDVVRIKADSAGKYISVGGQSFFKNVERTIKKSSRQSSIFSGRKTTFAHGINKRHPRSP